MAKKKARVRLVDTTFRDAQQSLLGGYLRTEEIVPIAAEMDSIGFTAMEAFGGATFETQLIIREDPWEFLRKLNKATPNTPIQALIRGQNLVSKRNFADDVVQLFIKHAARSGVDVFRVFDPLNDLRNMEASIAAALKTRKKVQGTLCYAMSPAHNLELWSSIAKGLVNMGCHEIVIKDTSGLLSPQATWELVTALKQMVKVPIDVHSHCSSGMAPMAYMAAVEAGADVLDVAMSPLAWGASQPAAESVVAALHGGEYDTGLELDNMWDAQRDVEELKRRHIEHLNPLADRVDASILRYQMPGFMLEDIFRELNAQDATGRMDEALAEVTRVRKDLGYPPLVAPIRQMIATQAVYNVIGGERYATVTQELKDYLQGLYGRPPVPADHELRRLVLGREEPITIRPADLLEPQVEAARQQVRKLGFEPTDDLVLIHLMFPQLAADYARGPQPPASNDGARPVEVKPAEAEVVPVAAA
ncbi:MAG TPA: pyruvate carboxylase subunit B, partial [Candidatus Acidoferrum sp.]|nr:pyruvate carboxylase subunit B [Candidatus Acidoferrum sp.]